MTSEEIRQIVADLLAPMNAKLEAALQQISAKVSVERFQALADEVRDLKHAPAKTRANLNLIIGATVLLVAVASCALAPIYGWLVLHLLNSTLK